MTAALEFNQTLYDQLCALADRGFPVFPVWGLDEKGNCLCGNKECPEKQQGKHPLSRFAPNGFKNAQLDKRVIREWVQRAPKANWAIRCGERDATGRYLAVLDVDPRNNGDVTWAALEEMHGPFPEGPLQDSGGDGGFHIFLGTDHAMEKGSLGPGIDFLAAGSYVIIDPSRHKSGGSYTWVVGRSLLDLRLPDAPDWILEGVGSKNADDRPRQAGEGSARDTVLGEAFFQAGKLGVEYPNGMIAVECPQAHLHSDGRGKGQDSSTVILPPVGGTRFGGFKCQHGHCTTLDWHEVLNALPPPAVFAAKQKYPMRPQPVAPDAEPVAVEAQPATTPRAPRDPLKACRDAVHYVQTARGGTKIKNDLVNVMTIFQFDPRWEGVLGFDEFHQQLTFLKPPPWSEYDKGAKQEPYWTDDDSMRLHLWMNRNWLLDISSEKLAQCAYIVGKRTVVNSLSNWIDSLEWDGVSRVDTFLIDYFGVEDNAYTRAAGRYWLISAMARALSPGCKADYVIILEGPQGIGKSEALRQLTGGDWFSDSPIDIGSKDAFTYMAGKWIIELAELSSLMRVDSDRSKQFFTSPVDNFRPPYGKHNVKVPRSCVFAGTVNPEDHGYLGDATGNRRYWPVLCTMADRVGLARDRAQIWAEAKKLYKDGQRWWPEGEVEHTLFRAHQAERETTDPWVVILGNYLTSETGLKIKQLRTVDLMSVLELDPGRFGRTEEMRVGRCLRKLGWQRRKTSRGNMYVRPTREAA